MEKTNGLNIPNMLSIFRIILIPVFLILYIGAKEQPYFIIAAAILLLSGLTDVLDGYIARRYKMVTQLGKIIDPLADKLTQLSVCVAVSLRYPWLTIFLGIVIIKELLMLIAGTRLMVKKVKITSSQWFGKAGTVIFYIAMLLIVALPNLPHALVYTLVIISAFFMIFAFVMYIPVFIRLIKSPEEPKNKKQDTK